MEQRSFGVLRSLGGSFVEDIMDFFFGWFSKSTAESVEDTLSGLKFPELDPTSQLFDEYDRFFGLGMLLAILVTAVYLAMVLRNQNAQSMVETVKIIPLTFFFGLSLPVVGYLLSSFLNVVAEGLIERITGSEYGESTFAFNPDIKFGFIDGLVARIGSFVLNLEFEVFSEHLILTMTAMAFCFALRWLGAFGDSWFVVATGLALMFVLGPLVSVAVLSLFWASYSNANLASNSIMLPVFLAAIAPLGILVLYLKTGLSQKVRGVMDSKQLSARAAYSSDGGGGSSALKAGAIGAGVGAVGSAYLNRKSSHENESSSGPESRRSKTSASLKTAAGTLARTNPVTAAGMYMGSLIVKDRKRPSGGGKPPTSKGTSSPSTQKLSPTDTSRPKQGRGMPYDRGESDE